MSYLLPHHFVFPAFLNLTKKNLYISNARSGLWNNKAYGNELKAVVVTTTKNQKQEPDESKKAHVETKKST